MNKTVTGIVCKQSWHSPPLEGAAESRGGCFIIITINHPTLRAPLQKRGMLIFTFNIPSKTKTPPNQEAFV
ncbi:hypothetical protein Q766_15865 [Flavobacterium subsaxonicum WB 4.1-42 = DSM 21790]|uniref:Uncharacterized protein n=1 Tax=Flavobacterium subsaxonicum WB 4.1-42 = DSM 21790 TaxID=1121898 RepID=A0A0A2MJI2_9FLAO|nr:hypothetical protein Q766_15865 [Flavobacterium subsaxonicum WB 4.1-42 = DSM 21790]